MPFSSPITSILLLLSISGLTHACSSRNAPKVRPPHVARPNVTYRTYPCPRTPSERLCLNGGACFTLFENSTDYFCKCAEGYCGPTCGDKYTRYGCYSSSLVIMASSGLSRPAETFPCPPGPAQWLCLNGGTCFTVFENGTDYACHCAEGYCGLTCGEKYTRYGCFSTYLVISASVASVGSVVICVIVVFVIVCIHYRKRVKRNKGDNWDLKFRPSHHTLSMPSELLDDLENEDVEDVDENLSKYLRNDDGHGNEKHYEDYSNLIALI